MTAFAVKLRPPFRGWFLPILALAIKLAFGRLCGSVIPREPWFALTLTVAYALTAAFILLNIRYPLFASLGILGLVFNYLVIALNSFYMPVSTSIGLTDIPASKAVAYRFADSGTKLAFLGDVIHIKLGSFEGLASVGDLLLLAAVAVMSVSLIASLVREFRAENKAKKAQ